MDIDKAVDAAVQALEVARVGCDDYHEKLYVDAILFFQQNRLVTVDKVMASFKEMILEGKIVGGS